MEYRIAKGYRTFFRVLAALFVLGGLFFLGRILYPSARLPFDLSLTLAVVLIGLGLLFWLDTARTLITIDDQAFSLVRLFRSRTMLLTDIDGYRKGEKETFSIEAKGGGSVLRIPQNLERRKELIEWITERYEDLDVREKSAETEVLLEDERFGLNREDREARLQIAKNFDRAATIAGFGLFAWAMFYPQPYELVMILLFLAPWLAIGVTWYFKGLLKLYKVKKSPYPSMVFLMCLPTFSSLLVVFGGYRSYGFGQKALVMLEGGTILVTLICITACWQAIRTSGKKVLTYVCIFVVAGAYSFSLLIFSNCHYDKAPATKYTVAVTHKRISQSRSTSYYISLSPWGRYTEGKEESVSRAFYESVGEQDSINVWLHSGRWSIPWYRLSH